MGTNYYLETDACDKCGRGDGPLHIGNSSAGWCFALHVGEDADDDVPCDLMIDRAVSDSTPPEGPTVHACCKACLSDAMLKIDVGPLFR